MPIYSHCYTFSSHHVISVFHQSVLVGRNRNAFCVVRPPGHHAGINGLLSNAESCGFCLFNNVAAGAMHALSDEKNRPRCERCAIVDIDAHHGNGTEEIVRKCHDSGRLLFFSVHLYDHDKPKKGQAFTYKFYPGTGAEDDVAHNVINVPIAPLWREKEVVKSIGLASNGLSTVVEPRQTRQRTKELSVNDLSKLASEDSTMQLKPRDGLLSQDSESVASESTSSSTKPRTQLPSSSPHYPPHYLMGTGRLAYRRAVQHRLLPALRAFNPDLIILSTGFDAARGDVGNARHYNNGTEAMGFDLEPEDYAWTARKVSSIFLSLHISFTFYTKLNNSCVCFAYLGLRGGRYLLPRSCSFCLGGRIWANAPSNPCPTFVWQCTCRGGPRAHQTSS